MAGLMDWLQVGSGTAGAPNTGFFKGANPIVTPDKLGTFLQYAGATAQNRDASGIMDDYRQRQMLSELTRKKEEGQQEAQGLLAQILGQRTPPKPVAPLSPAQSVASDTMDALGVTSKDDRELLAKTIQAEAGGEGLQGMLAVGAVMKNRANAGGYGDDLRNVIMKPGQFSAWNKVTGYAGGEGGLDMARITPSADAYRAADAILSGQYQDPTGGATHYYNPSVANPKWGRRAGGEWATIGNHIFGMADAGRDSYQAPSGLDPSRAAEILMNPNIPDFAKNLVMQNYMPAEQERVKGVEIDGKLVNPYTGEVIGDYTAAPAPMSSIAKLQSDLNAGLISQDQYNTAVSKMGAPSTTVNVGDQETAFSKETGKLLAQEAGDIVSAGMTAQRNLGTLGNLESTLMASPQGAPGAFVNMAASLGIKMEGASDIEAANALISQLVPQQRPPGSGQMSDRDVQLFKESLPRLINTPNGNRKIIDAMRSVQEYDVARMRIARRQQLGQLTPEQAFAEYEALGNPLAEFATVAPPPQSDSPKDNPYIGMTDQDFGSLDLNSLTDEQLDMLYAARGLN